MSENEIDVSSLPKLPRLESQISLGKFDNTGMGDAMVNDEPLKKEVPLAQENNGVFHEDSSPRKEEALSHTAKPGAKSPPTNADVNTVTESLNSKLVISSNINNGTCQANGKNVPASHVIHNESNENNDKNSVENGHAPFPDSDHAPLPDDHSHMSDKEITKIKSKLKRELAKLSTEMEEKLEELERLNNLMDNNMGIHVETADGGAFGQVKTEIMKPFNSARHSFPFHSRKPVLSGPTPNAPRYDMRHKNRGYCLIFNHSEFDPRTELGARNGTDRDRDCINQMFTLLGFETVIFNNLRARDVQYQIHMYAYEVDHSDNDCLAVFFLSHGEEGIIYAKDDQMNLEKMLGNFTAENCTTLAGKPKMFFIQACRGKKVSEDVTLMHVNYSHDEPDGVGMYKIPVQADFLVCYSTISDQYSWRNTLNGSWFIQSMCTVFRREAAFEDVLSMMVSVNRHMIVNFQSNCPSSPGMHNKKQSACIKTTAMRKIYFTPKE